MAARKNYNKTKDDKTKDEKAKDDKVKDEKTKEDKDKAKDGTKEKEMKDTMQQKSGIFSKFRKDSPRLPHKALTKCKDKKIIHVFCFNCKRFYMKMHGYSFLVGGGTGPVMLTPEGVHYERRRSNSAPSEENMEQEVKSAAAAAAAAGLLTINNLPRTRSSTSIDDLMQTSSQVIESYLASLQGSIAASTIANHVKMQIDLHILCNTILD